MGGGAAALIIAIIIVTVCVFMRRFVLYCIVFILGKVSYKIINISFPCPWKINPYLTNGVSHHYHLGESTFIFRGISSDF